jgi:hypothetical protein
LLSNREWVVGNNGKQQVLVDQIRDGGRDRDWEGRRRPRECDGKNLRRGKQTKAETEAIGSLEGQGRAGKETDGNRRGKGQKLKRRVIFVGWKVTRGPQRARIRLVKNLGKTNRTPEKVRFRS